MKKVFVVCFVLIFTLFNFKIIIAKEPISYFKLPAVHNQSLDTSLDGNDHLYPVNIDGLYGFININGKLVIEPKFNKFEVIDEGYFLVYTYNKGFSLDETNDKNLVNGSYIVTPKAKIIKVSNHWVSVMITDNKKYLLVQDCEKAYVSANGEITYDDFIFDIEKKAIVDRQKESYKIISIFDDFYIIKDKDLLYVKNYNKKTLISGYKVFLEYGDNIFIFKNGDTCYWVDKGGEIHFKYEGCEYALQFYNGVAPIIDTENNLIFIDKNKNILYSYSNVNSISKIFDFYIAHTQDDNYIIFDLNGMEKSSNYSDRQMSTDSNKEGTLTAIDKEKLIFDVFDKSGNIKESYKLNNQSDSPYLIGNYTALQENDLYGLAKINNGKKEWVLEPKYTYFLEDGPYAIIAEKNGSKTYEGLYSLSLNKFILEPKYTHIKVFDKNMIYVESNFFKGYVNSKGEFVYVQSSFDFGDDF